MADALAIESWLWYALSWVVVVIRLISRRLLRGSFTKLQIDDFLMIVVMLTDTILMVGMNIISHTSSNLINPDDHVVLTPQEISDREYGSKMVLVVEQMQILTTWLVKCCLLIMYSRLTLSLKQHLIVKIAAVYVGVGFVVMEILYFGVWCRPFTQYWAVPPDNIQCSAATNHLITNAVLNISSDLLIISIPLPIFISSQLPLRKKIILCCVFTVGLFTILSAVLNKYYSFTEPFGSSWTFWYIRESSTAIITANLPFTWTLIQKVFNVTSFYEKYASNHRSNAVYGAGTSNGGARHTDLSRLRRSRARGDASDDLDLEVWGAMGGPDSSQEQINKPGHEGGSTSGGSGSGSGETKRKDTPPLEIYERREVTVVHEDAAPGKARGEHMRGTSVATAAATATAGAGAVDADALRIPLPSLKHNHKGSDEGSTSDVSTMGIVTTCRGV